jgi:hypothetical protein
MPRQLRLMTIEHLRLYSSNIMRIAAIPETDCTGGVDPNETVMTDRNRTSEKRGLGSATI